MQIPLPNAEASRFVWEAQYRGTGPQADRSLDDTFRRVARALAEIEPHAAPAWEERFFGILRDFRFLPGGRILAGAGSPRRVTLLDGFVSGTLDDSLAGIFEAQKEAALTLQQGSGIGCDFSPLRPEGTAARTTGTRAAGPVSFLRLWDAFCSTLFGGGPRRGAVTATLACNHPDIAAFVDAKRAPGDLPAVHLAALVTDAFLAEVRRGGSWPLLFPAARLEGNGPTVSAPFPGETGAVPCRVVSTVPARALWERILEAAYAGSAPGVLFIDRINRLNNLAYRETITATSPHGEAPLPPYGACNLGSINLTRFVSSPFLRSAYLDLDALAATATLAVRMLDDAIDLSPFPLPQQGRQARGARRIGLGITGLADALALLGVHYGSEESRFLAGEAMRTVCHAAYRASIALAEERGPFPFFELEPYLASPFVASLPAELRDGIAAQGIRNSHLTAIAPAASVSLLAGNVSAGLEPLAARRAERRILGADGRPQTLPLTAHSLVRWQELEGNAQPRMDLFPIGRELSPRAQLEMQAALQPYVDGAIAKTLQVPEDLGFAAFREIYELADQLGLKGCTTFRPRPHNSEGLPTDAAAPEPAGPVAHC